MKSRSPSLGSKLVSLGFAAALAVVPSLTSPTPAEAVVPSVRYFLEIRGPVIAGESTDERHQDHIDLASFTMSFTQPGGGGAGGAGLPPGTCGNLRVVKNVDRASPQLVLSAMLGRVHNQAVLYGENQDGVDHFRLRLINVVVRSVTFSDTGGSPPAAEEVTLQAESVVLEYMQQDPRGGSGPLFRASINCGGGGAP